jgi:enoyl-CoA hydratase
MKTIVLDRPTDGIVVITLNRPKTLNSMTLELVRELHETCDELARDDSCRVVILTGAGRGFCSGHELSDFGEDGNGSGPLAPQTGLKVQEAFAGLTQRVNSLPQAVIAAVNGPAAGGGLALALAADTRVCSESARFNAAFIRLGISGCDVGVSYLLPKIVGPTVAFEMMLTGRLVDAAEALRTGLVLDVVPDGKVVDAALEVADRILANAPFAVRMTKQVMWANLDAPDLHTAIQLENRTQMLCVLTKDHLEAVAAFVERRPARFTDS